MSDSPPIVATKHLREYACASLRWRGTSSEDTSLHTGLALWRTVAGEGRVHLPLGLVCDVAEIVMQGLYTRFRSDDPGSWPQDERPLRLRYENELLGRLLREPAMLEALEILDTAADRAGPAIGLASYLLRRLAPLVPRVNRVNPAQLRGLGYLEHDEASLQQHEEAWLAHAGAEREPRRVLSGLLERVSNELRWSELLQPEDLFELSHWEVLRTPELQLGCRQVLELARSLGAVDVRKVSVAEEAPEVESSFVDHSHYPIGGICELTRRGSIESLVPSELVLMDPPSPGEEARPIDLFDLRWVEGELLFYLRDGGELLRKRRTIHLVCDLEEQLWFKPRGWPVQLGVLIQALFLRLIEDLRTVFSYDAVRFVVHLIAPANAMDRAGREAQVLRLLLADDVAHGRAEVRVGGALAPEEAAEKERKSYVLLATTRPGHWAGWLSELREQASPTVSLVVPVTPEPDSPTLGIPIHGGETASLGRLEDALVTRLCGLRSSRSAP